MDYLKEAPEGATHYDAELDMYYRILDGAVDLYAGDGEGWAYSLRTAQELYDDPRTHALHDPAEADAEPEDGMPEVGMECEYMPDPNRRYWWCKCTFLAHMDGEFFVLTEDNEVDRMSDRIPASERFRTLRRSVRDYVIAEAFNKLTEFREATQVLGELYDAGMLKLPYEK